jgi:prenyltransferase beta subunit
MTADSQELLDRQNPDGGWSYRAVGSSWTEPSCYAVLALCADGMSDSESVRRAIRWLAGRQRSDGGWAPRDGVDQSTWVTAATLLLPASVAGAMDRQRASQWLLAQTGRESGFVYRLRLRLLGATVDPSQKFDGWPWYPGAAAWVAPTALSILALDKFSRETQQTQIQDRVEQGRDFLLARRCRDGGWNHGSTHALGYDSDSYPETTGIAVLALHAESAPQMTQAVEVAERHLQDCQSLEGASWLTLALLARGRTPATVSVVPHGGTSEIALSVLARAAVDGRNLFLEG